MLKVSTGYAKIMPEKFSKNYIRKVIMLDLSQKRSNVNIRLKIMLQNNYARCMLNQVVIMPELS